MIMEIIFLIGNIMLLHVKGQYLTQVQTYIDTCNETITLRDTGGTGKLFYTHYEHQQTKRCRVVIEAEPGYHIAYGFSKQSAVRTIHSFHDHVYYICTSVTVFQGDMERKYECLNTSRNFTRQLESTQGNTLTLDILGDSSTSFTFEFVFFSFHYGKCNSNETSCWLMRNIRSTACVSQDSIINNPFIFCDGNDYGGYPDYKNPNGGLLAAIVLLCIILVPMLVFCGCFMYRRYCKQPEPEPEDIPTRARRIFAAIMEDAHDNAGYDTGPIDPDKFDPPPEYSSLEPLDGNHEGSTSQCDTRLSQISVENLPSYNDVMKNSNEYLVSFHM